LIPRPRPKPSRCCCASRRNCAPPPWWSPTTPNWRIVANASWGWGLSGGRS